MSTINLGVEHSRKRQRVDTLGILTAASFVNAGCDGLIVVPCDWELVHDAATGELLQWRSKKFRVLKDPMEYARNFVCPFQLGEPGDMYDFEPPVNVIYREDLDCSYSLSAFTQRRPGVLGPEPSGRDGPCRNPLIPGGPTYSSRPWHHAMLMKPIHDCNCLPLDDDVMASILLLAITTPADHACFALVCRHWERLTERVSIIAATAEKATRWARVAAVDAQSLAMRAFEEAAKSTAKVVEFDYGTWRGQALKRGMPDGLGVFKGHGGVLSAGRFWKGLEHGLGTYQYEDGSRYAGELRCGARHGVGVTEFVDRDDWEKRVVRYEGAWRRDKRHGMGCMLGGAFRFAFGFFAADDAKQLVMFDYHTADGSAERH